MSLLENYLTQHRIVVDLTRASTYISRENRNRVGFRQIPCNLIQIILVALNHSLLTAIVDTAVRSVKSQAIRSMMFGALFTL